MESFLQAVATRTLDTGLNTHGIFLSATSPLLPDDVQRSLVRRSQRSPAVAVVCRQWSQFVRERDRDERAAAKPILRNIRCLLDRLELIDLQQLSFANTDGVYVREEVPPEVPPGMSRSLHAAYLGTKWAECYMYGRFGVSGWVQNDYIAALHAGGDGPADLPAHYSKGPSDLPPYHPDYFNPGPILRAVMLARMLEKEDLRRVPLPMAVALRDIDESIRRWQGRYEHDSPKPW
jgi:hypothetical protein